MKNQLRPFGALLLGLSLCGGFVNVASAAPAKAPAKAAAKGAKPAANGKKPPMQRMFAAVSATPDQKKKVQAISKAQRAQVKAINSDAKLSAADKKTKVRAARKAGEGKVEAVMTAAQKTKLMAFRKQIKAENKAEAAAKKAKK